MRHVYKTKGVCSRTVSFELDHGVVRDVKAEGGCDGNLQGIAMLVEGMEAKEVVKRLEGIRCGGKKTSCPDQLSLALRQILEMSEEKEHPEAKE